VTWGSAGMLLSLYQTGDQDCISNHRYPVKIVLLGIFIVGIPRSLPNSHLGNGGIIFYSEFSERL
jgi:hypothetical protein